MMAASQQAMTNGTMPGAPRLRMESVKKSFGPTRALKNVTFEAAPGQVHVLIGENGAGKSTLMKILSGAHQPDAGVVELDGEPYAPENPLAARRRGVAMVYQELTLAPHLTVEENILLGEEPSRLGWLNRRRSRELAREALAALRHESIPLEAPVSSRSIAEQQVVEIARGLSGNPKVLIMDEPTSSLTAADTEDLFAIIERLRARGVSIVYISHFLEECQRIGDRYTVLRDGESVAAGEMKSADLGEIIRSMVGREVGEIYPRTEHQLGEAALELREVAGRKRPCGASLTVRAGEIFGLAGLIGAGRTETLRACFGLDDVESGVVVVRGKERTREAPGQRLKEGMGLLSENRKEEGLMLNQSLADNLTLTRHGPFVRCGFVDNGRQDEMTREWMARLEVKARHPRQTASELSGGNQQKIALGRLLHHEAEILLLDEPTRGIDVGSKAQIYRLMGELAAQGKAIIFVSSYLPELLGVCDTIGVMCRGKVAETRPAAEWTEHEIMAAAIGQGGGCAE